MKMISTWLCLFACCLFVVGCMDEDGAADESGEGGVPNAAHSASDADAASPITKKNAPDDGAAEFNDDAMPPGGSGDASGQIGSGAEADGGGGTGITQPGELTGETSSGSEDAKIETDGSDPGDS